jgi:NADH:ubiquinone oxidoreductase subunit C
MLPDILAEDIRQIGEANGGSLLLDSAHGRAILRDSIRVLDICRSLKRSGFTRFVDFTGMHNGAESFTLYLSLRAPEHNHARLTLKWKWTQPAQAPCDNAQRGAGQPGDELQAGPVLNGAGLRTRHDQSEDRSHSIHPSLSTIWPAAAVAEREIFEMLGIPFAGNALEPLLLDEAFVGHPLRSGFEFTQPESFIEKELRRRHEAGLVDALRSATEPVGEGLVPSHVEFQNNDIATTAGGHEARPYDRSERSND